LLLLLSPVTGFFSLVLLQKQWRSPPFKLQVSNHITFRIMCDVPSTDVFCSEFTACFPAMASRFSLNLLLLYYYYYCFIIIPFITFLSSSPTFKMAATSPKCRLTHKKSIKNKFTIKTDLPNDCVKNISISYNSGSRLFTKDCGAARTSSEGNFKCDSISLAITCDNG
jgi:hypothetical protein